MTIGGVDHLLRSNCRARCSPVTSDEEVLLRVLGFCLARKALGGAHKYPADGARYPPTRGRPEARLVERVFPHLECDPVAVDSEESPDLMAKKFPLRAASNLPSPFSGLSSESRPRAGPGATAVEKARRAEWNACSARAGRAVGWRPARRCRPVEPSRHKPLSRRAPLWLHLGMDGRFFGSRRRSRIRSSQGAAGLLGERRRCSRGGTTRRG
jgi:hypothetical protein